MIAEQYQSSSPVVEWTHADPVTGSSHAVPQSGSITGLDNVRTELEPFGQEVLPTQPPEEPQTGESAGSLKSATEPEWQCGLAYRDFWEMPVNCKIAALESNSVSFDDLHQTEYSVTKIVLQDSRTPNLSQPYRNSPSDNILTYARKAVYKSEKSKESLFKMGDEIDAGQLGYVEVRDIWDRDKSYFGKW